MSIAEEVHETHQYSPRKTTLIKDIKELSTNYKTIGLTRLDGITSNVLQNIRRSLRGSTVIKVSKNTLKRIAFKEAVKARPDLEQLMPYLVHSTALVFSNENPFALMKFFDKNRVAVFAKPGQVVNQDVWVNAGPTDFNPGPIISEFNSIGIRTSVQQAKVHIQKDVKILSAGETVSETHASIMSKLSIKPVKMGITLNYAIDETGNFYKEADLTVNDEEIKDQLITAYQQAFNLTVKLGIATEKNIKVLLNKANQSALNVSLKVGYPTKENIKPLLAITEAKAKALQPIADE